MLRRDLRVLYLRRLLNSVQALKRMIVDDQVAANRETSFPQGPKQDELAGSNTAAGQE
jgi:hypothetical protein